ncbi:histidine triad nucleotide-binding protein 3-like [Drosophila innubila]|uniref:histidine triad nucleotide-binding protein 3-like n=1 Tax=Drosophila innubila TaxID=198719 RepID=UPI00148DFF09|nr:histidine triad nucleotide-binding protein 3-like [Drosophila innubila]
MSPSDCIFCDISSGKSDTILEVETDEFAIFKDIRPASKHHYLIVTKEHYESLMTLDKSHGKMILRMEKAMKDFFKSKGISLKEAVFGFHMPPFISVKHLHLHGVSPYSKVILNHYRFEPSAPWFKNAKEAQAYLIEGRKVLVAP